MPTLYDYFRSSASFRVRIALELKGVEYERSPVHLVRDGGEQHAPWYRALQPSGLVPLWVDAGGAISQSLAIVEYLDETYPEPALLPTSPADRAWVRSVALSVACDIHPLNNLRVLQYLGRELGASEEARKAWYAHWVESGLASVEAMLGARAETPGASTPLGFQPTARFAFGDTPTLAEVCIVPQVANALRFSCKLSHVPRLVALYEHCMSLPAFQRAAPEALESV
jgi:maleylpyruvate isomerase